MEIACIFLVDVVLIHALWILWCVSCDVHHHGFPCSFITLCIAFSPLALFGVGVGALSRDFNVSCCLVKVAIPSFGNHLWFMLYKANVGSVDTNLKSSSFLLSLRVKILEQWEPVDWIIILCRVYYILASSRNVRQCLGCTVGLWKIYLGPCLLAATIIQPLCSWSEFNLNKTPLWFEPKTSGVMTARTRIDFFYSFQWCDGGGSIISQHSVSSFSSEWLLSCNAESIMMFNLGWHCNSISTTHCRRGEG